MIEGPLWVSSAHRMLTCKLLESSGHSSSVAPIPVDQISWQQGCSKIFPKNTEKRRKLVQRPLVGIHNGFMRLAVTLTGRKIRCESACSLFSWKCKKFVARWFAAICIAWILPEPFRRGGKKRGRPFFLVVVLVCSGLAPLFQFYCFYSILICGIPEKLWNLFWPRAQ